jgi:thiaminase (transcriptional activator TenA)
MTTNVRLRPSDALLESAMPIWKTILEHPFLRDLRDGSLPLETFRFYIKQDWLYIQERISQWAILAGRCQDPDVRRSLALLLDNVARLEPAAFHLKHAPALEIDLEHVDWEMNAANWAYTSHETAAVYSGGAAEGLAALLPCPLVYQFVGKHLMGEGRLPSNPFYADWIAFYGSGLGDPRRETLLSLYDRLAVSADQPTLARCERNFLISSRYEWQFWDAAYRRETWPI